MGLISIDGNILKKMFVCGANNLTRHSQELDALNVFPVPDGDTGVNMAHTVQAAAKEVLKLNTPNVYEVAKTASGGALRGARGNSGVILSQLYRGFAKGLEGKSVADAKDLALALDESSKMAYRAVMKPKEGTILTIAKSLGESAVKMSEPDIELGFKEVIKAGNEMLEQTPMMLPELKQAGVVDSGGKGLIYFMEGALAGLLSEDMPTLLTDGDSTSEQSTENRPAAATFSTEDIKFIYCTEFLIDMKEPISESQEENLTKFLMSRGDSVVVVSDDIMVKVHVHANNPGTVLERALTLGSLDNIKIENMRTQHTNVLEFSSLAPETTPDRPTGSKPEAASNRSAGPTKDIGFVAVVAGSGFAELFTDMGADEVIEGGQTMNPSADDIAQAVSIVNARHVVVLPNNKNIILAAEQAVNLVNDVEMHVIPTKSVPQGIACLLDYIEGQDLQEYLSTIEERIADVHTGQVTYAVRDTVASGHDIKKGDILCLYDGEIVSSGADIQDSAKRLLDFMLKEQGSEFVSIYYGENATEDMAQELVGYLTDGRPFMEVEAFNGGQPLYYYMFSME